MDTLSYKIGITIEFFRGRNDPEIPLDTGSSQTCRTTYNFGGVDIIRSGRGRGSTQHSQCSADSESACYALNLFLKKIINGFSELAEFN